MRPIKLIFRLIGLAFTALGVLYSVELLIQLTSPSQCIYLHRSVNENNVSEGTVTNHAVGNEQIIDHESPATPKSVDSKGNPRILIWVLTGPSRHMSHAWHVKQTWAAHFDKLLFMSSEKDDRLGTIALPNVTEGHDKLWPKTQKAFQYVWEHHKDDTDWFMKADDDTFVVSHNLRAFLKDLNPNEPHYLGHTAKWDNSPIPANF